MITLVSHMTPYAKRVAKLLDSDMMSGGYTVRKLTAEQYEALPETEKVLLDEVDFIPPKIGDSHLGYFKVVTKLGGF